MWSENGEHTGAFFELTSHITSVNVLNNTIGTCWGTVPGSKPPRIRATPASVTACRLPTTCRPPHTWPEIQMHTATSQTHLTTKYHTCADIGPRRAPHNVRPLRASQRVQFPSLSRPVSRLRSHRPAVHKVLPHGMLPTPRTSPQQSQKPQQRRGPSSRPTLGSSLGASLG